METEPQSNDDLLAAEKLDGFSQKPPQPADGLPPPLEAIPVLRVPAVWPVFVAYLVALCGVFAAQIGLVIILVVWLAASGVKPQELAPTLLNEITNPGTFISLASVSQLVILVTAVAAAWLAPDRLSWTLGLRKPALPLLAYPVVLASVLFTLAVGAVLAEGLNRVIPQDQTLERVISRVTSGIALPVIAFIALVPGFVEELFFRGYVQRRLLQRWAPWQAILVSSALFSIMHLDPTQVIGTLPMALWLGVIAWRTGSVWPCMLCHACFNATSMSWHLGQRLLGWPEDPPLLPAASAGVVVFGCFLVSVWVLFRRPAASPYPNTGEDFNRSSEGP
jgi:membrane protease YdiL (CAAX protease family)